MSNTAKSIDILITSLKVYIIMLIVHNQIILRSVHGKNGFAERSKFLARYRSEK